jgi:hypothetical protein
VDKLHGGGRRRQLAKDAGHNQADPILGPRLFQESMLHDAAGLELSATPAGAQIVSLGSDFATLHRFSVSGTLGLGETLAGRWFGNWVDGDDLDRGRLWFIPFQSSPGNFDVAVLVEESGKAGPFQMVAEAHGSRFLDGGLRIVFGDWCFVPGLGGFIHTGLFP